MRSSADSSLAKTVANFAILVDTCEHLGPAIYKPLRADLKIGALREALEAARSGVENCDTAEARLREARRATKQGFVGFTKKISRIYAALQTSGSDLGLDERARFLVCTLRGGRRRKSDSAPNPQANAPIGPFSVPTTAQTRLHTADDFLKLLAGACDYAPSEDDLKLEVLQAWILSLVQLVDAENIAEINFRRRRDARDACIYGAKFGLIDLAAECRAYLRTVLGTESASYRRLAKLRFQRQG